jgi:hypothetical protein
MSYTIQEALAREHSREYLRNAEHARLSRELVAIRRWHRLVIRAREAELRHAQRADQLASAATLTERSWA